MSQTFSKSKQTHHILIVEDDPADALLIKNSVQKIWPNSKIQETKSMWETYDALKKSMFNLILLDLNLEDTLGFSSVSEIRKLDRNSSVVVLTNHITDLTISECLKAGANHVAPKEYIGGDMFHDILNEHVKI